MPEAAAWRKRVEDELKSMREERVSETAPGRRAAKQGLSAFHKTRREGTFLRIVGLDGHKASDDSGLIHYLGPPQPRSGHVQQQWEQLVVCPLERGEIKRLM